MYSSFQQNIILGKKFPSRPAQLPELSMGQSGSDFQGSAKQSFTYGYVHGGQISNELQLKASYKCVSNYRTHGLERRYPWDNLDMYAPPLMFVKKGV